MIGCPEEDYIYGLWREDIASGLTWETQAPLGINNSSSILVPRWSWAAVKAPVNWWNHKESFQKRPLFDAELASDRCNGLKLKVTGFVFPVKLLSTDQSDTRVEQLAPHRTYQSSDCLFDKTPSCADVCLLLYVNTTSKKPGATEGPNLHTPLYRFLILQQIDNGVKAYIRQGTCGIVVGEQFAEGYPDEPKCINEHMEIFPLEKQTTILA